MSSLQDALYNWLTIKVVCDARPDDSAAIETMELFEGALASDHGITNLETKKDETLYHVSYTINGETNQKRFPIELVEFMLTQINENPEMYRNYPIEDE